MLLAQREPPDRRALRVLPVLQVLPGRLVLREPLVQRVLPEPQAPLVPQA